MDIASAVIVPDPPSGTPPSAAPPSAASPSTPSLRHDESPTDALNNPSELEVTQMNALNSPADLEQDHSVRTMSRWGKLCLTVAVQPGRSTDISRNTMMWMSSTATTRRNLKIEGPVPYVRTAARPTVRYGSLTCFLVLLRSSPCSRSGASTDDVYCGFLGCEYHSKQGAPHPQQSIPQTRRARAGGIDSPAEQASAAA